MVENLHIPIKFVKKGWGYEKWIINKPEYCGKLLYFVKGKKETGNLLLHNPFTNFNYCWFNGKLVKIITPNQYNSQVVKIYPQPGKLIVFPSWLQHSVEPNLTNEERVSISFDIN